MSLSVIIPTYNNVEFLSELFDSIEKNLYNGDYEVLIGIDSCENTLNFIYENSFPKNFKFFFFFENVGPYVIKNTLTQKSNYEKILFFDSDDIMMPKLLEVVDQSLDVYHIIKPKYLDFEDKNQKKVFESKKATFGEGVFGVKKSLFLEMNGFEGWRVAADSDFMGRVYKTNKKILHTQNVLFHRRLHSNSLTIHPSTGLASKLRGTYFRMSKSKTKDHFKNEQLIISEFKIVDVENRDLLKSNPNITQNDISNEYEEKKSRHESISDIFSNRQKKSSLPLTPKTINYEKINNVTNKQTQSNLINALKKAKLEEIKRKPRRY